MEQSIEDRIYIALFPGPLRNIIHSPSNSFSPVREPNELDTYLSSLEDFAWYDTPPKDDPVRTQFEDLKHKVLKEVMEDVNEKYKWGLAGAEEHLIRYLSNEEVDKATKEYFASIDTAYPEEGCNITERTRHGDTLPSGFLGIRGYDDTPLDALEDVMPEECLTQAREELTVMSQFEDPIDTNTKNVTYYIELFLRSDGIIISVSIGNGKRQFDTKITDQLSYTYKQVLMQIILDNVPVTLTQLQDLLRKSGYHLAIDEMKSEEYDEPTPLSDKDMSEYKVAIASHIVQSIKDEYYPEIKEIDVTYQDDDVLTIELHVTEDAIESEITATPEYTDNVQTQYSYDTPESELALLCEIAHMAIHGVTSKGDHTLTHNTLSVGGLLHEYIELISKKAEELINNNSH